MKIDSLSKAFVLELKDLYSVEKQLLRALPKMAKAATNKKLAASFTTHLEQTKEHAERLEQLLEELGETTRGEKCKGIEGIIEEAADMMEKDVTPEVMDALLVSGAQRAEHYEISGYGTAIAFAETLGLKDAVEVLQLTLKEESATDELLTALAESTINPAAAAVSDEDADE